MLEEIIYSKFSNDRACRYRIKTDIVCRGADKYVRKTAMTQESVPHVMAMTTAEERLNGTFGTAGFVPNKIAHVGVDYVEFEYVEGESYDALLDRCVSMADREGTMKFIRIFMDKLERCAAEEFQPNEQFKQYFGETVFDKPLRAVPVCNIDAIFQNIIVDADGNWNMIDYEWTLNCAVPVDYIKYRALMLYMNGLSKREVVKSWNLYEEFGISESALAQYSAMEAHFQGYIKGDHVQLGEIYHLYGKPAVVTARLMEDAERQLISVYPDYGNGFDENTVRQYAQFPICIAAEPGMKQVRIDPMSNSCLVERLEVIDNCGEAVEYTTNGAKLGEGLYYFDSNDPWIAVTTSELDGSGIKVNMKVTKASEVIADILKAREQLQESYAKEAYEHAAALNAIAARDNTIRAMQQSLSWRMTWPMRKLIDSTYRLIHRHRATAVLYDGSRYLLLNGPRATYRRIGELYGHKSVVLPESQFQLSDEVVQEQRNKRFSYEPVVSILVPLYNTPEKFLREMIESVTAQTYSHWQLCLADGSDDQHSQVEKICREYYKKDKRITYQKLSENGGISENTNACIELANGDFIGLFDHDDLLTQDALYEVVCRINEDAQVDVVYTDEDKLLYNDKDGSCQYVEPHCKSDFNLDLLRTNNYICHFFVVRKSIVDEVGGFRREYDGSQDFDFIFRCVERARKVAHIAKILYHWRIHANSTAANPQSKMYCYEAGKHAIEAHLERQGVEAKVEMLEHLGFYRVIYPVRENPLVSIVIPNKDEKETLQTCVESILAKSTYHNYEIVIVENNSTTKEIFSYYEELIKNPRIRVERWEEEFNYSKINNFGVQRSKGEYILLLNNDVEVITPGWIEELLSNCQREEVGITGAKLIYPDNTVQHCGVIIGLGGIAGHAFVGLDRNHPGYFGRAIVQQNLSAVTAACFMVSRKIFDEVGGLEETLQVAFNDVDFCLKVRAAGYLNVMNPNVQLYHYESKSRGAEDTPQKQARFAGEVQYMAEHWTQILRDGDPYYNPNLTLVRGDFSMKDVGEVAPVYV